jgi:hypothetical protein
MNAASRRRKTFRKKARGTADLFHGTPAQAGQVGFASPDFP